MSDSVPLVSVIVPVYNGARVVGETIESLLAQDHPRVEIVAVDDGSTDESASVLAAFPGTRRRRPTDPVSAAVPEPEPEVEEVAASV